MNQSDDGSSTGLIFPAGWSLIILGLMWYPLPGTGENPFRGMDLLIHAGLFLVLGAWFQHSIAKTKSSSLLAKALIAVCFVGLTAEFGQLWLETRQFQTLDLGLNLGYGVLGLYLVPRNPSYLFDPRVTAGLGLVVTGGLFSLFGSTVVVSPGFTMTIVWQTAGTVGILVGCYLGIRTWTGTPILEPAGLILAALLLGVPNPYPAVITGWVVTAGIGLNIPSIEKRIPIRSVRPAVLVLLTLCALWGIQSNFPNQVWVTEYTGWFVLATTTTGLLYYSLTAD